MLSLLAGFVNAFSVVNLAASTSATTGAITESGVAFGFEKDGLTGLYLVLQVLTFMFGSMLGGFIAPARRMRIGLPYGVALMVEGVFLAASTVLLRFNYAIAARFPIAFAMGCQNGLSTYYSNAVIRLLTLLECVRISA